MYGQSVVDKEKEVPKDILRVDNKDQCKTSGKLSEGVTTFRAVEMFSALKDTFVDEYDIWVFESQNDFRSEEKSSSWDNG